MHIIDISYLEYEVLRFSGREMVEDHIFVFDCDFPLNFRRSRPKHLVSQACACSRPLLDLRGLDGIEVSRGSIGNRELCDYCGMSRGADLCYIRGEQMLASGCQRLHEGGYS